MTKITALRDKILAEMIEQPDGFRKSSGGIIIADKDNDVSGIRPRWFRVYSVGEGIDWCEPGDYLFVAHGRWSNGVKLDENTKIFQLDNEECLGISKDYPLTEGN